MPDPAPTQRRRPARAVRTTRVRLWLLGGLLGLAAGGCALPRVHTPATALLHDDAVDNPQRDVLLAVNGRGFGAATPGRVVRLRSDGRLLLALPSSDRTRVPLWSDRRIVLIVPAAIAAQPRLTVDVSSGAIASVRNPVVFFDYAHVDVPRSDPNTNPSPLAVAVDARSRVAVVEEFLTQLKRFDPAAGWQVFELPRGPMNTIFASTLFGDDPSPVSLLGEAVLVDPAGRIWATQGGWMLYNGERPNHSRILMVDAAGAVHIWPVPGDDNSVVGLAYDAASGRVWFTQAQRARRIDDTEYIALPARLTSFDPNAIAADASFDFAVRERCEHTDGDPVGVCSTTRGRRCFDDHDCILADRICRDGDGDQHACFRDYAIPTPPGETALALPGPLLRHSDGTLWFSGYGGGNFVGRFDPVSETFQRFPLPRPPGEASCDLRECICWQPEDPRPPCPARCCLYRFLGRGPWGLAEDRTGNLAIAAQEAGAIAVLRRERFDDPRCATLGTDGANPCLIEYRLPNYDAETTQLHSVAYDGDGTLWFGESRIDGRDRSPARGATLGYIAADRGEVILLPPPSLYPFASGGKDCRPAGEPVAHSVNGIAVDPHSGAVWYADYCRKRLGRVTAVRR
jgi:streptogramin lyase